MISFLYLA